MWWKKSELKLLSLIWLWLTDKEISKKMWKTEDSIRNKRKRLWEVKNEIIVLPKILVLDVETAPIELYSWTLYDENHNIGQVINDSFILWFSAKELGSDVVSSYFVTSKESRNKDDKRIAKEAWKLLNEYDIVITHNGDKFDLKKLNTAFIKHWLFAPAPYRSVDTLKVARSSFGMLSHKLDYWCKFLWLKGKVDTGWFDLWKGCVEWDISALNLMESYCENDVIILESLYYRLRPYIKNHPNLGAYTDSWEIICPNCGSDNLKWWMVTVLNRRKYETARCECWAIVKKPTSVTNKKVWKE